MSYLPIIQIVELVAAKYRSSVRAILADEDELPRKVAIYLSCTMTRRTWPEIAKIFDVRTVRVRYIYDQIGNRRGRDAKLDLVLKELEAELQVKAKSYERIQAAGRLVA